MHVTARPPASYAATSAIRDLRMRAFATGRTRASNIHCQNAQASAAASWQPRRASRPWLTAPPITCSATNPVDTLQLQSAPRRAHAGWPAALRRVKPRYAAKRSGPHPTQPSASPRVTPVTGAPRTWPAPQPRPTCMRARPRRCACSLRSALTCCRRRTRRWAWPQTWRRRRSRRRRGCSCRRRRSARAGAP
jgi:hypothetical protein